MSPREPGKRVATPPIDQRLRELHEISMELSRQPDESSLCRRAVELCTSRLGFDRIGIWFIDLSDPRYMIGSWGTDERGRPRDERASRVFRSYRHKREELFAGAIPFVIVPGDTVLDDRSNPVGVSDKAIAPLWDGATFVGELVADNLITRRPIGEQDGEILVFFARTVAHLRALKRSEAALKEALAAKAVLLGELQHRTKNSFALIESLVSIEASRAAEPTLAEAFTKLRNRVTVLTSLYAHLDDSGGHRKVRLDHYLERIALDLLDGYGAETRGIALERALDAIEIDMGRAVPLGLIVNELITDSLKYAFPDGRQGRVALELRRGEPSELAATLSISDDGVGLPEGFSVRGSTGLGITLVDSLCGQIGASLELGEGLPRPEGRGAAFRIRFGPLSAPAD